MSRTEQLFRKALKKSKKRIAKLEKDMKLYEQLKGLDQEKVEKYLKNLESFDVEYEELEDRLKDFQERFKEFGNPRHFDYVVEMSFIDIAFVKDMIKNCK